MDETSSEPTQYHLSTALSPDSSSTTSHFNISTHGHNNFDDEDYHYGHDQWTCFNCFKTISPSRHSGNIADFCSCTDVGLCTKDSIDSNYRSEPLSDSGSSYQKIRSCKTRSEIYLDRTYNIKAHDHKKFLKVGRVFPALWAEPTERIYQTNSLSDYYCCGAANATGSHKDRHCSQKLCRSEGTLNSELAEQLKKSVNRLILALSIAPEELTYCTALESPVRRR